MRATLIYPPASDPRAPQLALPSLAAVMRPAGIDTTLLDLNALSMDALLRPDRLRRAADLVQMNAPADLDDVKGRLAAIADRVVEQSTSALAALRDARFFDAAEYNAAREVVTAALDLAAAATSPSLRYNIAPIQYDVVGADVAKLADLIRITGDPRTNVFAAHWEEDVFPALDRDRPDLIGITITNRQQIVPGLTLARALKERGHFVVLGGPVYTKFHAQLPERPDFFRHFADGLVVYEGETAILELCHQLENKRHFERVPNYLYLEGDAVKVTSNHTENVDRLPTPDFEGLPLDRYLAPRPVLPILTGKGCYFNRCKFCDIPYINHIANKAYRTRSPERIVADIRTLSQRFGAHHFVITDEALSPKLLVKLADAMRPYSDEHYRFTGYARLEDGFTAEVAGRMAELGLKKVFFGLESASQKTLDHMDKGTLVAEAPTILGHMKDAGIDFHVFSIVGFPEETTADAEDTFRFFAENQAVIDAPGNTFDIHPFGLELRTDYWRDRDRFGIEVDPSIINRDFVMGLRTHEWTNTRGLDGKSIQALIYGDYLPRLRRIYRRWHNTVNQLHPGFEEYAVLYGDAWHGRDFGFGTTLPERGDPRRFTLRINPAWGVRPQGGHVDIIARASSYSMETATYEALAAGLHADMETLLASQGATPESEARLRAVTDEMMQTGMLQLVFDHEPPQLPAASPRAVAS